MKTVSKKYVIQSIRKKLDQNLFVNRAGKGGDKKIVMFFAESSFAPVTEDRMSLFCLVATCSALKRFLKQ